MTDPTGPTASQDFAPDVDRTVKFYRVSPSQRVEYVAPLIGRDVTGEYRHGNTARVPFNGRLTVAYDPIRRMYVAVIDPGAPHGPVIALNLSSLYTIHPTGAPA